VLDGTTGLLWGGSATRRGVGGADQDADESDLLDASPSVSRRSMFATFAELRAVGSHQTYAEAKSASEMHQVAKHLLLSDGFLSPWPKADPALSLFRL